MLQIHRVMARAHLVPGQEQAACQVVKEAHTPHALIQAGTLLTAAAYHWENQLFIYYECINCEHLPSELLPELNSFLMDWPGHEVVLKWVPKIDVFHFNAPVNLEHWLRKTPVERRVGRIAKLKPDMVASYIYYHYQLQEERAFLGGKYEIIAIHENLLFGYQEFPSIVEEPLVPPKLHTNGTPANWNDSRMDLHFQPWPDGHLYFKPIEELFALYGGDQYITEHFA